MNSRERILKSPEYWMEMVQGAVFRLLSEFMEKNNLNQTQVAAQLNFSSSYVSQILNGNFNFTIGKLISLALAVGKVPVLSFKPIDEYLKEEKYPENGYKFSHQINSDGGCLVHIHMSDDDLDSVMADEFMTVGKKIISNNSLSELSYNE